MKRLLAAAIATFALAAHAQTFPTKPLRLEATNWRGFVAPAATPPPAVARLNRDLNAALATAEVQARFKSFGMIPSPSTPEQFDAFLKAESALYARVVKEAGVKAE